MYNVLICDDQPDIVNALKIYLASEDYRLFEAANGEEALELVRREDIHLVLLDVMMPRMDGITATVKIREISNIPIILLTAKSETEDMVLGLNVGADDYITKPFVPLLLMGLAVLVLSLVYLIASAGRTPDGQTVSPNGLNRLPLDLYTAILMGGIVLLWIAGFEWMRNVLDLDAESFHPDLLVMSGLPFVGIAVLVLAWIFALAAQLKAGNYWWKNSVIGRCLCWMRRGGRWVRRRIGQAFTALHAMGQGLLVLLAVVVAIALTGLGAAASFDGFGWFVLLLAELAAVVLVAAYAVSSFSTLLEGARRMAEGDLNQKVPTVHLRGSFADCANQLNALADVAVVAAQKQMKSERMKTELITNVSHDIKTPLTSIVSYVDLLKKPHTEEQGAVYLDVLACQSARMKKLIEDLMEMSKATTGNMQVALTAVDAAESVSQALGEFSDKLAAVPLTPVVRIPEEPVMVHADGRLVWRTLSNLLQNAVKYALPGTRLYVELHRTTDEVQISLKNVSRDALNITAEELMERFVRGDASRSTEGSGLGLNIARSLMELQHGRLELLIDGDLFKASLIFRAET